MLWTHILQSHLTKLDETYSTYKNIIEDMEHLTLAETNDLILNRGKKITMSQMQTDVPLHPCHIKGGNIAKSQTVI